MKRVRGVEESTPPSSAGPGIKPQQHNTSTAGVGGGGGGGGSNTTTTTILTSSGGTPLQDYHPVTSIGVVPTQQQQQQQVGAIPIKATMPSNIQFGAAQQQYPSTIVVPLGAGAGGAPTAVKGPLVNLTTASAPGVPQPQQTPQNVGNTPTTICHIAGLGNPNHGIIAPAGAPQQQQQQPPPPQPPQQQPQPQQPTVQMMQAPPSNMTSSQFTRLKVEDALSYLDQVKFKFSDQPQVYNDFLDIMKEFKSQSIDTPGVITRVSHLFKGHPELIVGFNTFLPPGYKIEVQANEQGYAFQVSVSMPSPTATHTHTLSHQHCINVGSAPIPSPPTQAAKTQPIVQIMQGSGNIYHSISNNISNNSCVHGPSSSPPVQPYNNSHVSAAQAQAVSQALSQAQDGIPNSGQTQQNQPVEFNHAINYVNKIKNRFQGQPDKYKRFLEILHTYQKEQRTLKESSHMGGGGVATNMGSGPGGGGGKHLTEAEVYSQVAKLFENQEDLLMEFGQFLPDATNQQSALSAMFQSNKVGAANDHAAIVKKPMSIKTSYNNAGPMARDPSGPGGMDRDNRDHGRGQDRDRDRPGNRDMNAGQKFVHTLPNQLKRSPSFSTSMASGNTHGTPHGPPPPKKHKVANQARDASIGDVSKHGTLNDYAFFDKVRKALRSQEVYENFLRCLVLFNQEIISKVELVQLITPFLGRFPELLRWFKDFLGHLPENALNNNNQGNIEALPNNVVRSHQDRPQGDLAMDIDYTTCKRLGASYCALPKSYLQPKCSGRTQLCKEVLNDTWVSFPTWSEDSTFVTSRKTQFEEFIYRCEDERFELDGVIETNAATIRVLEGVHKKMNRMSQEDIQRFKLDDCLGGCSPTIHQRALRRIYGEKAADIIDGLKKNPLVAVPVVLRRLKSKEEEWREAQKGFNKIWREQNEKYYLKSLDHQGINFKQNDVKALRSKSLFNEIEILYDERHEQAEDNGENTNGSGPHLILAYKDKTLLDDAANLLIHHVKRQTAIHKDDKQRIKILLKHFIPDLFFHPRQELSDDEQDDDNDKDDNASVASGGGSGNGGPQPSTSANVGPTSSQATNNPASAQSGSNRKKSTDSPSPTSTAEQAIKSDEDVKPPPHALTNDPNEAYALFMGSNHWYLFLRLHQILCERLTKMYERAVVLAEEESRYKQQRKDSTAVALRLKPKNDIEIEDYYPAFLDMVKNVLDGNMESSAYEDTLREMFGIHAYIAFTLDKVVSNAVRQLQHLVTDTICQQCTELFQREQRQSKENCGAGGPCSTAYLRVAAEAAYQRKAEKVMAEENCFKIYVYKNDCKITIELLDTEAEENAEGNDQSNRERDREVVVATEKWSTYVERYSTPTGQGSPKDPSTQQTSATSQPPATNTASDNNGSEQPNSSTTTTTTTPTTATASNGQQPVDGNGWSSVGKALAGRKRIFLHRNVRRYRKHAARKMRNFSPEPANSEKVTDSIDGKKAFEAIHEATDGSDLITSDEMQCTFNLNKYRVVYVVNQETTLYNKGCLTRAKQSHPAVTKTMHEKFHKWTTAWAAKNVVDSQHRFCQDWLMGRYENIIPHRTRVISDNDLSKIPYRQYNRYRVEKVSDQSSGGDQSATRTKE